MITVRNKSTGEYRDVEESELVELRKEVKPDGFPVWEQTSYANAADVKEKATYGELLEHHYGDDYKAVLKNEALVLDAQGVAPEANPHLSLTPGEVEEGLTPEDKLEQLRKHYAPSVPTRQLLEAEAEEAIAGEASKVRKAAPKTKGTRARAGGSEPDSKPDSGNSAPDVSEQAAAVVADGDDSNDSTDENSGGSEF